MLARLTERRVPGSCRHRLEPSAIATLMEAVDVGLRAVDARVVAHDEGLELVVEVTDEQAPEAMREAFGVGLSTFRAATDGWQATQGPRLQVSTPSGAERLDRIGLPLALYGGPQDEGDVELADGLVGVSLPDGPADRLGRLAALVVALLRGDETGPDPLPLVPDGDRRRWRGLGSHGRATRLGPGEVVQRRALALLETLEPSPALQLESEDRVLLREELTGALPLPVDDAQPAPRSDRTLGVSPAAGSEPPVSIVLACHGEQHRVMLTVEALRTSTSPGYEVVVVDDGSPDGCCDFLREDPEGYPEVTLVTQEQQGSARARNSGVAHARAPIIVFMDAHCFPRAGWLDLMLEVLEDPSVGIVTPAIGVAGRPANRGYGLSIAGPQLMARWLPCQGDEPYRVPAAGAGCIAMHRGVFEAIGGFEPMRRYGVEDLELSIRCWLAGFDVVVQPKAEVGHWFKERNTFSLAWEDYLYNVLRTAVLHFDGPQLRTILEGCSKDAAFGASMTLLLTSDVWARRADVRSRAVRDGAWFCKRFGIDLSRG